MRRALFGLHAVCTIAAAVAAVGGRHDASAFQTPCCRDICRYRTARGSSSAEENSFAGASTPPVFATRCAGDSRLYFYPLRRGPATFPESPPRQQSEELWQRRQRRRCRDQGTGVTLTLAGDDNRTNGEIGGTGAGSSELGAAVGGGDAGSGYGNPTPAVVTAEAAKRGEKRPLPPKKRFRGLMADRFQHPFDLEATAMLRLLPGLELAIRSVVPLIEDAVYMENIANSILVGPRQMGSLHKLLVEACEVLDMQVPDMYIRQNPQPNAYTLAIRSKKPFIVLHTSLVDLMEPEEVQAVIAHELGHLKCEHGIWVTLATVLANGLYRGGFLGAFLADRLGLRRSLMRWSRAAEFTCDRAAMLVAQDVNVVVSTLLKLAGGSVKQRYALYWFMCRSIGSIYGSNASELSVSEFLKQASAYELASQSRIGRLLKNSQSMELTHPLPVIRARELVKFSKSPQYMDLVRRGSPLYNN